MKNRKKRSIPSASEFSQRTNKKAVRL